MTPLKSMSKIMRLGLAGGLAFMLAGSLMAVAGRYTESLHLSVENLKNSTLFTDGAGLMYIGTVFIILSPVAVLVYLTFFYVFSDRKRYALYCLMILIVLGLVVMTRFS